MSTAKQHKYRESCNHLLWNISPQAKANPHYTWEYLNSGCKVCSTYCL